VKKVVLSALLALGVMAAPVSATEIIITSEIPVTTNPSLYIEQFLKEIETKTHGEVKGKYFAASQLYNDRDALVALGTGAVHMVWPVASRLELFDKRTGVLSLPFELNEKQLTNACFAKGLAEQMSSYLEPAGLGVLGFLRTAELIFLMRNKEVTSVADLKRQKIRVVGGRVMLDAMRTVDASPISMAASEMSVALSQGTIDGAMTSPAGWTDVLGMSAKYGALFPGMSLATSPVVVDKVWFDGLPQAHKTAIQEVLDGIIERQWKETVEKDKALVKQMVDQGAVYHVVPDSEVKLLRDAFNKASADFIKENADAIQALRELDKRCLQG